jgi:hypothetical protein
MKKGYMKWIIVAVLAFLAYKNWDKIKKMLGMGTDTPTDETAKAMEIQADLNDEI